MFAIVSSILKFHYRELSVFSVVSCCFVLFFSVSEIFMLLQRTGINTYIDHTYICRGTLLGKVWHLKSILLFDWDVLQRMLFEANV